MAGHADVVMSVCFSISQKKTQLSHLKTMIECHGKESEAFGQVEAVVLCGTGRIGDMFNCFHYSHVSRTYDAFTKTATHEFNSLHGHNKRTRVVRFLSERTIPVVEGDRTYFVIARVWEMDTSYFGCSPAQTPIVLTIRVVGTKTYDVQAINQHVRKALGRDLDWEWAIVEHFDSEFSEDLEMDQAPQLSEREFKRIDEIPIRYQWFEGLENDIVDIHATIPWRVFSAFLVHDPKGRVIMFVHDLNRLVDIEAQKRFVRELCPRLPALAVFTADNRLNDVMAYLDAKALTQ